MFGYITVGINKLFSMYIFVISTKEFCAIYTKNASNY